MARKPIVAAFIIIFALVLYNVNAAHAQNKITGPWLWMIVPTEAGQGGYASTNADSLAEASGGDVTEEIIANNGAKEGDRVGNLAWTLGEISATGGNNINDTVIEIGLGEGDVNDHTSYALITLESDTDQAGVEMKVGSDDSIKVWLNGEVVHTNAVNRGASDFQDTFRVDIKRGDNLLLVKVSERGGGWSMFVGINANVNAVHKSAGKVSVSWEYVKAEQRRPVPFSFNAPATVSVGDRFTVNINLGRTVELVGAQFNLSFNPTVLKVNDLQEGELLSEDGTRLFFQVRDIDNITGHLNGINILRLTGDGVSGNGTLLKIVFTAKASGESTFAMRAVKIGNVTGEALPYDAPDAKVRVEAEISPDVTGDGKVDILDLVLITRHFGQVTPQSLNMDMNGDGGIDILDLIILTQQLKK